jgi:RnfABCDGE-type electron transport complex D subunit
MFSVIVALLPATGYGIFHFGLKAFYIIALAVFTAVCSEKLFCIITKRKSTIGDFSAIVTGLLLGLNLPVSVPLWIPVLGSFFAIVVVKMLFGGLGQNFMNPALGARCFLVISFASIMTDFSIDGVSSATPLQAMRAGDSVNLLDMLKGNTLGTIGETSALALLIGAVLLIILNVIDVSIPLTYIGTFVVFMGIFGGKGFDAIFLTQHVLGGGLILGAFFMATDYVTRPITFAGRIIYGIILGLLTGIFRVFGPSGEGVSYAIILSNLLVPLIEKVTVPTFFGKRGTKNA